MAKISEADVEHIAKTMHEIDSDNYTLSWGKQSARLRSQERRTVRGVLAALHYAGFDVTRRASLSPEQ